MWNSEEQRICILFNFFNPSPYTTYMFTFRGRAHATKFHIIKGSLNYRHGCILILLEHRNWREASRQGMCKVILLIFPLTIHLWALNDRAHLLHWELPSRWRRVRWRWGQRSSRRVPYDHHPIVISTSHGFHEPRHLLRPCKRPSLFLHYLSVGGNPIFLRRCGEVVLSALKELWRHGWGIRCWRGVLNGKRDPAGSRGRSRINDVPELGVVKVSVVDGELGEGHRCKVKRE